ncbi:MAG: RNA-binding protein [Betaproteobacteria bacterium RBG_16_56_24]|nr:MAG: RNA-binding protein [Betaproteobacteria bacterium RBG_16_56_24]
MSTDDNTEKFRIDKWLCAARFFKTRSLAADAVECGKVHINEARVKPAKAVAPGDILDIHIGQKQYVVEVLALSNRRGPVSAAQKLYRETDESRQRRETIAAQLKAVPQPFRFRGRPTKRDRREIERFRQGKNS